MIDELGGPAGAATRVAEDPPESRPGSGRAPRPGRSKRGYFIPGLIALVAMAAVGGIWNFGGLDHAAPDRLAGRDVQTYLAQAIQSSQGLASSPTIRCPGSEPVRAGLSFTCHWQGPGGSRAVAVTETDTRGQFRYSVEPAG